jgi:glycine/D-amino acid oxidase-like deaminating enzyme
VISDELAGFHTPDEGSVDPNLALSALVRAGAELGVRYRPCTEVLAIEEDHVLTNRGPLACDDVVVTCGADSAAVLAGTGISVELVESAGSIVHLAPRRRFLDPVLLSSDVHAIQRSDGRTVIAKHYTGTPVDDPTDLDSEKLLADATSVLPVLAGAEIERTTVGRRIVPADGLPIVGHSDTHPHIHSITTNAGITLGPMLAQLMSTEIVDDIRIDVLDPYRSTRFD